MSNRRLVPPEDQLAKFIRDTNDRLARIERRQQAASDTLFQSGLTIGDVQVAAARNLDGTRTVTFTNPELKTSYQITF